MATRRKPLVKMEDPVKVKLEDFANVKLENGAEPKLQETADGGPVDLEGDVRKHWAQCALTRYREAVDKQPRKFLSQFPSKTDKSKARKTILAAIETKLQLPVFKYHDRVTALDMLCGDVLCELTVKAPVSSSKPLVKRNTHINKEVLDTVRRVVRSNSPVDRKTHIKEEDPAAVQREVLSNLATTTQNDGTPMETDKECQVIFESLTPANKADWILKFVAVATVPQHLRPRDFLDQRSARQYLLSMVKAKFQVFTPASDDGISAFASVTSRALTALEKGGQIRWPKPVRPQAPTPAIKIAVKDTPEFKAGVDESHRRGYSQGFEAGRAAAYAELKAQGHSRQQINSAGPDLGVAHTRVKSELTEEGEGRSTDGPTTVRSSTQTRPRLRVLGPSSLGEGLSSVSNNSRGEAQTTAVPGINTLGRTRLQTASMVRKRSVSLEDGEIKTEPQAKKRNRL